MKSLKLNQIEYNGKLTGFIHIVNDGLGDVVKSDEMHIISGKDWFTEKYLDFNLKFHPFLPIFSDEHKGAEVLLYKSKRLYNLVKSIEQEYPEEIDTAAVNKANNIKILKKQYYRCKKRFRCRGGIQRKGSFDLYSGTGTIAQIIAPVAKKS